LLSSSIADLEAITFQVVLKICRLLSQNPMSVGSLKDA
jgi:hypothetical protein